MKLAASMSFCLLLLFFARPAHAVIYQYFDDEGTLIVTNIPHGPEKAAPAPDRGGEQKIEPGEKYTYAGLGFRDDVKYDFYPVRAHTFQEAVMATNMNGPFEAGENKRYAAQTKWNMGWSYKLRSTYVIERPYVRVSPEIYDFEFRSDITVLLPVLTEDSGLSAHDGILWEKFVRGLLDHEHDHVALIKDASFREETMREISAIKEITLDYDTSAALGDEIKSAVEARTAQIGHDLIRGIKKRNDEYDRLTEHGLKPEMRRIYFR